MVRQFEEVGAGNGESTLSYCRLPWIRRKVTKLDKLRKKIQISSNSEADEDISAETENLSIEIQNFYPLKLRTFSTCAHFGRFGQIR